MDIEKPWLSSFPWEEVQSLNQSLCKEQSTAYQANQTFDIIRQLWEKDAKQRMSLTEVLEVCRHCYEMAPFTFNNGNTFATIGKNLLTDWLNTLPPVESQIIANTVGHYIAGVISKRELLKVLQHFETSWKTYTAAREILPATRPVQSKPNQSRASAGLEGAMLTPPQ